jgi:PAS domain S-box-containing protein
MNLFSSTVFSRRSLLAWLVLLVGLSIVAVVWIGLQEQRNRNAEEQFGFHVRELVAAIEKRLRDHEQILLGGAGLFDASEDVSRSAWRDYVQRLQLKDNYPGIQGVGFSQVIKPAELPAHVAAIRAEGFPDYALRPAGERSLYTSIIYLEPFVDRNLAAFGYDMYSEQIRRKAMQTAVDRNTTTISGKVRLVQETHGREQAGFLMYVPVYHRNMPLTTAEERWRALRGYVYSPYRVDDLMRGILGESDLLVDFTLHDGSIAVANAVMHDSAAAHADGPGNASAYSATHRIPAYEHVWTITLNSRPAFQARFASRLDWLVPSLGAGISLSLFILTLSLLNRQEQALALAGEMTARRAESEGHFRQLFLHMGQGVLIYDSDGRIIDANPAAERILGLSLAEMGDRPQWWTIRDDGGDDPDTGHPAALALRHGRPVTGVVMDVRHPGESRRRWIRLDAYPHLEGAGARERRIYAVFSDITEQRAADLEVRNTRKLLSDVLAAASELSIIATDTDGLITIFNTGAERMLGYRSEEIVGRQSPAILHLPEEVAARGRELSAAFGRPIEGFRVFVEKPERAGSELREWTYVHKDGHRIPVSLVVTTMRDAAGEVIGYLGIAEDITERKQAEKALREQAQHTQDILNNMVDGIITIDQDGIVMSYNPAAERIFGYSAEEVRGQNVRMLMPNPYRDAHDGYLRNYQTTGVARVIGVGREVEGQRKDGSLLPIDLAVSEITHHGRPIYVGVVRDITERKRLERMKSEFVSTVSHELRTPLTSISGALGLISGGALGRLPEQVREMIDIARNNSQRLTYLINDLLDMEKLAAGKMHFDMQPQALLPLVAQAVEANRIYGAERRVTIAMPRQAADIEVWVDSQRLMQVLSNLLSNAIKYSPEEGVVEIGVESRGRSVLVTVTDHGPGVPTAFQRRIFQKFAQADASDTRQKGGTGLGLAITKELVERMGGRTGFNSVEGEGACFYFELPVWNASKHTPDSDRYLSPAHDDPRILVVEDEPDVARLLALMLTRAGYAVDTVSDGAAALAALQRSHYAAMTLDLMLPDISGLEVIRQLRLRPETAHLPIIVVSAKMEDGRLAINGEFSGIDWMAKPIDETHLLRVIGGLVTSADRLPRVLHVEDDADLHRVIRTMAGGHCEFELATSLREAHARLAREHFDVLLLDIGLQDGSGWDLLPEIRALQPHARVVILSGAELTAADARRVEAVLLKSQVTPRQLLDAIDARVQTVTTQGGRS